MDNKTMEELKPTAGTTEEALVMADALKSQEGAKQNLSKTLRMSPQKRDIYALPKDHLLKHNALIVHKASSLSSTQRKLIVERVAYGINTGSITMDEVVEEVNSLTKFVMEKIEEDDLI